MGKMRDMGVRFWDKMGEESEGEGALSLFLDYDHCSSRGFFGTAKFGEWGVVSTRLYAIQSMILGRERYSLHWDVLMSRSTIYDLNSPCTLSSCEFGVLSIIYHLMRVDVFFFHTLMGFQYVGRSNSGESECWDFCWLWRPGTRAVRDRVIVVNSIIGFRCPYDNLRCFVCRNYARWRSNSRKNNKNNKERTCRKTNTYRVRIREWRHHWVCEEMTI